MNQFTYLVVKLLIIALIKTFIKVDKKIYNGKYTGPKIYTANHPTTLDPLFVMSVLKDNVSVLMTHTVFNIPIIGFILKKSGHIPVLDNQGRLAYQQALSKLRSGKSILIFPEGHLSSSSSGLGYRSGAIRLALETGAPIVPIGISVKGKVINKKIKIKERIDFAKFFIAGKYALTSRSYQYVHGDIQNKEIIDRKKLSLMSTINSLARESGSRLC